MASSSKGAPQDSGSAATASTSQLQQEGLQEAAAGGLCPICLGEMDNKAYPDTCFHTFCFVCIQQWAALTAACPLCKTPLRRILHTVKAENDYEVYLVASPTRQRRTAARRRDVVRQRVRSRSPQPCYNLRPQPNDTNTTTTNNTNN